MNQPLMPQQPGQNRNLAQIIANLGQQSGLVAHSTVDPRALAAGIKPSFASVTFKGKVWGIRHRAQTQQLLTRDPTTGQVVAIPYIDVIIVKSATAISKAFYIDKYKEGDYRQPDCWSTNGQVPDPAAPKKQSVTCRGCQWDAFGSRTGDDGRKGKACSDNKRIAVVPAADIKNEAFGGPMLLKLPPSSFAGLSELEVQLHMQGYTYFALIMRCTFDHTVAYPKVVFTPIGVLNDYQMQEVLNLQQSEIVDRILNEELFETSADPEQPTPDQLQPHQPQPQAHQPQPQPVQQPLPVQTMPAHQPQPVQPTPIQPMQPTAFNATAPAPAPQPTVQPVVTTGFTMQPPAQPQPLQVVTPTTVAQLPQGQPVHQPQPAPVQQPSQQVDPGPLPAHLQRTNGATPPQPTAAQPTPGAATETPEQTIARLQAELAAATAKPARQPRKRTQPVTPTGPQQPAVVVQPPPSALPGDQPLPFTAHAQPPQGTADDDGGDAPPDLDSRIDNLLNPGGGTPQS